MFCSGLICLFISIIHLCLVVKNVMLKLIGLLSTPYKSPQSPPPPSPPPTYSN